MSNLEKIKNAQADLLISEMTKDIGIAYRLYAKLKEVNDDDLDDFANKVSGWLQTELSFNTDWDHFCVRFAEFEKSSLELWKGTYYLASDDYKIYRLRIADAKKSDADEEGPQMLVFLNGISLKDYSFENKTLSWNVPDAPKGSTKGQLVFSNYADRLKETDFDGSGNYFGAYCEGDIIPKNGEKSTIVKGKVGVYSYRPLRSGYGEVDSLDDWAGQYAIYMADKDKSEKHEANLLILPSENGQKNVIKFNDVPIEYDVQGGTLLNWSVRVNNVKVNDNSASLSFLKSPSNKKVVTGHIRLADAKEFLAAGGIQTEKVADKNGTLKITTSALPSSFVDESLTCHLQASGGTTPYCWEISDVPDGLTVDNEGKISGTPTKAGLYQINATVTDSCEEKDQAYIDLKLNQNPASSKDSGSPTISQIISWIAPLAGVVIAVIGIRSNFNNRKSTKEIEKKKLDVAKQALREKIDAEIKTKTDPLKTNISDLNEEVERLQQESQEAEAEKARVDEQHQRETETRDAIIAELEAEKGRLKEELEKAKREANKEVQDAVEKELKKNSEATEKESSDQAAAEKEAEEEKRNEEHETEPIDAEGE